MAAENTITAMGASGASFGFEVYPWGTTFNPVGGLYLVLKKEVTGNYNLLYVGQTGDLSARFASHHKQPYFDRYGKTHIAVRAEGSEGRRLAVESDLIRKYNPVCNG